MLIGPHFPREADARLHFIDDEQELVLVGKLAKRVKKLGTKMTITALSLNRLDDEPGNVVRVVDERLLDLLDRLRLDGNDSLYMVLERERDFWIDDARPVELRKVHGLARIGRVRQRKGIPGASVKSFLEVEDLLALLTRDAVFRVLAHLPIERRLQGVLDGNRAPRDHEQMR